MNALTVYINNEIYTIYHTLKTGGGGKGIRVRRIRIKGRYFAPVAIFISFNNFFQIEQIYFFLIKKQNE